VCNHLCHAAGFIHLLLNDIAGALLHTAGSAAGDARTDVGAAGGATAKPCQCCLESLVLLASPVRLESSLARGWLSSPVALPAHSCTSAHAELFAVPVSKLVSVAA
jgi:hypothetical protein